MGMEQVLESLGLGLRLQSVSVGIKFKLFNFLRFLIYALVGPFLSPSEGNHTLSIVFIFTLSLALTIVCRLYI